MTAFLGTADMSAVLRVCVYVVCNLVKMGQRSHDPDLPKSLPTYRGVLNLLDCIIRLVFSMIPSCSLPSDLAVGEKATDNF